MFVTFHERTTYHGGTFGEKMSRTARNSIGFTLIELMIVIAVIAILLSLALPAYSDYVIRAKISESLSVAAAAKTATSSACQEDPTMTGLTNSMVGYGFSEFNHEHVYIQNLVVSGECINPIITITTKNTGAPDPQPIITLTGDFTVGNGQITWQCASANTSNVLLPPTCRS